MPPPLKPDLRLTQADDMQVVANALLTTTDGRYYKFEIDQEMAERLMADLDYHMSRQEHRRREYGHIEAQAKAARRAD